MLQAYLIGALLLAFVAFLFTIYGSGDWLATKLSEEKSVYERFIGKKLRRLFLEVTPQEFIMGHIVFIVVMAGLFWYLTGSIIGVPIGIAAGIFLPSVWLDMQWTKRVKQIEEQVEESMIFMSNSFKANPSLPEAMQDVCNSMGPPITQEISLMLKEYKLGTPLDQAMINMQQRVGSRNLQLAISALLVGRTVGGNIPQILDDISGTIRESYRLERVIDTQTAQGRMQAWVMGAAPGLVTGLFYLLDETLIAPLFNSFMGYAVIAIAVAFNILGVVLILKIVRIDV